MRIKTPLAFGHEGNKMIVVWEKVESVMGKKLMEGTRKAKVQNKFLINQFNALVFNL